MSTATDYFAILVVKHTPEVIAHASTPEEMVDLLRGSAALRYLAIDTLAADKIANSARRAVSLAGNVSYVGLPLFDGAKLFIQARR